MKFLLFTKIDESYMLPCLNKRIFGLDCPGCGIQRAMALLVQGDFYGAFHMYPAIYPLLLLAVVLAITLFSKSKLLVRLKIFLLFTTVATIIISYILKMN